MYVKESVELRDTCMTKHVRVGGSQVVLNDQITLDARRRRSEPRVIELEFSTSRSGRA